MRPKSAGEGDCNFWYVSAAQAIASGGEHNTARINGLLSCWRCHHELYQSIGKRSDLSDMVLVAHVKFECLTIPAQIVHPLRAWNFVERRPGIHSELRFKPSAKGESR